ncbi:MAG TPA: winged helix-turn-helix domain-containing protein, partial [Clostridiaceae bacterium]|nr:winged helix-turn-helix domain-containing protein [Clostridiaceae bacterium]
AYQKEWELSKFLTRSFSGKSLEDEIREFKEKYGVEDKVLRKMLKPLLPIYKKLHSVLVTDDYRYRLFFKPVEETLSIADILVKTLFPLLPQEKADQKDEANRIVATILLENEESIEVSFEERNYSDRSVLREDIVKSSLEDELKYRLLYLLDDFDRAKAAFLSYLSLYDSVMEELAGDFEKIAKDFYDELKDLDQKELKLRFYENIPLKMDVAKDIIIVPNIIQYNIIDASDTLFLRKSDKAAISFGIFVSPMMAIAKSSQNLEERFMKATKILSDSSKFEIIRFCHKKPSYGQEIADHLKISNATVSYHMQQLINASYVTVQVDMNKVYYKTSIEAILKDLSHIREILK